MLLADPEAMAYHDEPVLRDGVLVGKTTSAAYGHTLGATVALATVRDGGEVDTAQRLHPVPGRRRGRHRRPNDHLAAPAVRPSIRPTQREKHLNRYILTLSCADRPGIVHSVTSGLLDVEANINESAQYGDADSGLFFIRTAFESPVDDVEKIREAVRSNTAHLEADLQVRPAGERCRVLIMVSAFDHCLVDLLYRWRIGDLPVDVVGVVSNHEVCRPIAEQYGVPFEHVAVSAESKPEAEARLLAIVKETDTDLVVLARYMQTLSNDLCRELSGRAVNIHHSFLPGFKGARPYHQAHTRGVKLIGATAHYVTADLDEGPIIEQDVVRVRHSDSADQLVGIGRDVERRVLAGAVRAHAEHRVFLTGSRTVVFH